MSDNYSEPEKDFICHFGAKYSYNFPKSSLLIEYNWKKLINAFSLQNHSDKLWLYRDNFFGDLIKKSISWYFLSVKKVEEKERLLKKVGN